MDIKCGSNLGFSFGSSRQTGIESCSALFAGAADTGSGFNDAEPATCHTSSLPLFFG